MACMIVFHFCAVMCQVTQIKWLILKEACNVYSKCSISGHSTWIIYIEISALPQVLEVHADIFINKTGYGIMLYSSQKKPGIQLKTLKKKLKHFFKFTNYIFWEYTAVNKAGNSDSEIAESGAEHQLVPLCLSTNLYYILIQIWQANENGCTVGAQWHSY